MPSEHRLEAQVLTPEGEVFKGELFQLSTRTKVGEVGIRAKHAPLVGQLVPNELRLHVSENPSETIRFAQGEGWLEVFANRARVLVSEAIPPDQLDASELREQLADAEQRIGSEEPGSAALEVAKRDRDRAVAFLRIAEGS